MQGRGFFFFHTDKAKKRPGKRDWRKGGRRDDAPAGQLVEVSF